MANKKNVSTCGGIEPIKLTKKKETDKPTKKVVRKSQKKKR